MKLDKSRSFGTIWGHTFASFEQDGKMFDGAGNLCGQEQARFVEKPAVQVTSKSVLKAKKFLSELLAGGKVAKSVVHREAENANQAWPDVEEASALLNIRKIEIRKVIHWQLQGDA